MAKLNLNSKENSAIVKALKKVKETQWTGNTTQDRLDKCLAGLNLESNNSGWYNPKAIKINGLTGIFMVNENNTIYYDARIIKESEDVFRIEYMTNQGFRNFEAFYCEFLEN